MLPGENVEQPPAQPQPPAANPPPQDAPTDSPQSEPAPGGDMDPRISKSFALLEKREQGLVQRDKELKQREQELSSLGEELAQYRDLGKRLKEDPLGALQDLGMPLEHLLDRSIKDGQPGERELIDDLRTEVQRLKDTYEQDKTEAQKRQEEQQNAAAKQAHESLLREGADFITANPDSYEILAAKPDEAAKQLYQVRLAHWQKQVDDGVEQPKLLSVDEAAKTFEETVAEEWKTIAKLPKFQGILRELLDGAPPKEDNPNTPHVSDGAPRSSAPRTLSSDVAPQSGGSQTEQRPTQDTSYRRDLQDFVQAVKQQAQSR